MGLKFGIKTFGNPSLVTTELSYSAFPNVVRAPGAGDYLCAYTNNTSHYGPSGRGLVRRSADLEMWSDPLILSGQTSGFGWGPAGLAAETEDQGGRIYMGMVQTEWLPNSQTISNVRPFIRWSDDDGATWGLMQPMPGGGAAGAWLFYPSSLIVLQDGRVMFAGYGADKKARFYISADRGATWGGCGAFTVIGRQLEEPQLIQLADGRVFCFMRSDSTSGDGSEYLFKAQFDPTALTWTGPTVFTYDGGGCPVPSEIAPGWVQIMYRGWIDRTDPTRRPLRGLTIGLDAGWGRGNQDFFMGQYAGRSLYTKMIDGYLIFAVEGPGGSTKPAAQIWSVPYVVKQFA